MQDNQIGKIISQKRHEAGLTQIELADYLCVSKATVSKWESGKNQPDIALLPVLASFFDISLDELMGYKPQMTERSIEALYTELTSALSVKSADEVFEKCRSYIKKYYFCSQLNLKMSSFMYNHYTLSANPKQILNEICEITERICRNSKTDDIKKQAKYIYTCCLIQLGNFEAAEKNAEALISPAMNMPVMLSYIYYSQGKSEDSHNIINSYIEQNLQLLFSAIPNACLYSDTEDKERMLKRYEDILSAAQAEIYYPEHLLGFYFAKAMVYCKADKPEKALDALEDFINLFEAKKASYEKNEKNCFIKSEHKLISTYFTEEIFSVKIVLASTVDFLANDNSMSSLKDYKKYKLIIKKINSYMEAYND